MLGINRQEIDRQAAIRKHLLALLLIIVLGIGLVSCGTPQSKSLVPGFAKPSGRLAEVAPPSVIAELRQALDVYQPQVKIISPRANEVLQDDRVSVKLQVQDLPLFQNEALQMGPHLHFILDNQPYQAIYDSSKPVELTDLEPGTHTIRVFAARPWHESFKNEGAYAETTFHVFTQTPANYPAARQPLLTYSRPKGSYGAEPILLDFYLTNAPLHLVAKQDTEDDIPDWQIRCTVNGESFVFDRWEPIYLKGFKPGKNWVQLELLDEHGDPIPNTFNNTARIITYEPNGRDTLSQLVRGELAAADARGIVDRNYVPPVVVEPTPEVSPEPSLEESPAEPAPADLAEPPAATPEPSLDRLEPPEALSPSEPSSKPIAPKAPEAPEPSEKAEVPVTQPVEIIAPPAIAPAVKPTVEPTPEAAPALPVPASPTSEKVKEELSEEVEDLLQGQVEPSAPTEYSSMQDAETSSASTLIPLTLPDFPEDIPTIEPSPEPEPSRLRELFNRSKGIFEGLLQHPDEQENEAEET